jgi:L-ascorbate 6-phosphate lactonase
VVSPLDTLRALPSGDGRIALSWLGQAGFALAAGGAVALIDPFLAPHPKRRYDAPVRPADLDGVDVVLCTHEHIDHFDAESAPAIAGASPGAVFVVPKPIVGMVEEAGIARDRILGLQPGDVHEIAGLSVEAVPARHGVTMEDAYGFGEALSGGLVRFLGYVIAAGGVRVYHAGDTIHYDGMEATVAPLEPDVALLPVNGRHAEREARGIVGNLNEREAAWLADAIGAHTLVRMLHDLVVGHLGSSAAVVHAAEVEDRNVTVVVPHRDSPFLLAAGGLR